jgi:endonuclease/exonuclease/phosphatase (EEP) superfamily protein YafD
VTDWHIPAVRAAAANLACHTGLVPPRTLVVRAGTVIAWLVLVALAGLALIRIVQPGASLDVIALVAVTPWPFFLAWPIAVAGLVLRKWPIAATALALVVVQVVIVLPTWHPWVTAAAADGPWRLKVFDANVRYNNPSLAGIAGEIAKDRPDVVALEELSPQNIQSLLSTGAVAGYRWHTIQLTGVNSTGFGVWSDTPLTGSEVWYAGQHAEFAATLHPPSGSPISLLVVHTFAPRGAFYANKAWAAELSVIAARAVAAPKPLVVVGDFNATNDMKQFRVLLHQHLHDAAVTRGQGWRMTWPRDHLLVRPFLRPDHLLYSTGLTATHYTLGNGAGSDHRPLLITLARAA